MKNSLYSATKITLLWVVFILGLMCAYSVFMGINRGSLDPKDVLTLFGLIATNIVSFYFGKSQAPEVIPSAPQV